VLVQHIGQETLVYSEEFHKAFCLNPLAAQVWGLLDGVRTPEQLATAVTSMLSMRVTEDLVLFTLSELQRDGLVDEVAQSTTAFVAPNRRDLIRQMGVGALAMLPVVAAVMAPTAAQAYTGCLNCNVISGPPNAMLKQQAVAQQRAAATKAKAQHDNNIFGSPTLTQ